MNAIRIYPSEMFQVAVQLPAPESMFVYSFRILAIPTRRYHTRRARSKAARRWNAANQGCKYKLVARRVGEHNRFGFNLEDKA
jgi:hypothetical protein